MTKKQNTPTATPTHYSADEAAKTLGTTTTTFLYLVERGDVAQPNEDGVWNATDIARGVLKKVTGTIVVPPADDPVDDTGEASPQE